MASYFSSNEEKSNVSPEGTQILNQQLAHKVVNGYCRSMTNLISWQHFRIVPEETIKILVDFYYWIPAFWFVETNKMTEINLLGLFN